jgi:hypothetical protein
MVLLIGLFCFPLKRQGIILKRLWQVWQVFFSKKKHISRMVMRFMATLSDAWRGALHNAALIKFLPNVVWY